MNKWILIKILITLLLIYNIYDLYIRLKDYIENEETRERLSASLVLIKTMGIIVMLIILLYGFPNK
jgi:hypothetical protein